MGGTRSSRELLASIRDSAQQILLYAERGGSGWHRDRLYVDAISKRLEEIGELAKLIAREHTDDRLTSATGIAWRGARAMRDVVAHDFHALDIDILRDVVERSVPEIAAIDVGRALSQLVQT